MLRFDLMSRELSLPSTCDKVKEALIKSSKRRHSANGKHAVRKGTLSPLTMRAYSGLKVSNCASYAGRVPFLTASLREVLRVETSRFYLIRVS